MKRSTGEIEELYARLRSRYASRNQRILDNKLFFKGQHWRFFAASDPAIDAGSTDDATDATEETLTINMARVVVQKYTSLLSQGYKMRVPQPAQKDARARAQSREDFLRGMQGEILKAFRRAEHNASKVGFGVLHAQFVRDGQEPQVKMLGVGKDKRPIIDYTFRSARSHFLFTSIPPEHFYPVFRAFDDPNADLYYCIVAEPGRLVEDVRERYGKQLQATGGWDLLDGSQVEPNCTLLTYWDDKDYYLVAQTRLKDTTQGATVGRRVQRALRRGDEQPAERWVALDHQEHIWGRPPYWVIPNLFEGEEDPTDDGTCSDVDVVKELNRRYNETLSEAATEIRTHIHRPMVYKSDEPQQDVAAITFEPNNVIPIGAEEELESIKWEPMPQMVTEYLDRLERLMRHVAFLNEASFGEIEPGRGASGPMLRLALASMEQMLTLKLPSRVDALVHLHGALLAYTEEMLRVSEQTVLDPQTGEQTTAPARALYRSKKKTLKGATQFQTQELRLSDIGGEYEVMVEFANALPQDRLQNEQNESYKHKANTQSLRTTLENQNVDDPDLEIERIKEEFQDAVLFPERAMQIKQAQAAAGQEQKPPEGGPPQPGPAPESMPPIPRSQAPTVPSTPATPGSVNAPGFERQPVPAGGGPLETPGQGAPPGPGINEGGY